MAPHAGLELPAGARIKKKTNNQKLSGGGGICAPRAQHGRVPTFQTLDTSYLKLKAWYSLANDSLRINQSRQFIFFQRQNRKRNVFKPGQWNHIINISGHSWTFLNISLPKISMNVSKWKCVKICDVVKSTRSVFLGFWLKINFILFFPVHKNSLI